MSSSGKKIILYGVEMSPPVRSVLLTLEALQLDYEFRAVNVASGEHLTAEYLAKNPQHTVPTLEDVDGTTVWDSHAIAAYLVRKYSKQTNDSLSLYPKDFKLRAICDQRLHYENGVLFSTCMRQITRPLLYEDNPDIPQQKIDQIYVAYEMLNTFLKDNDYMVGGHVTIADFSIVTTVSTLNLTFAPIDETLFPKLTAWLRRLQKLPYYEKANGSGLNAFVQRAESKLPKDFDKLWKRSVADLKAKKH